MNIRIILFLMMCSGLSSAKMVLPDSLQDTYSAFNNYVDFIYLQLDDSTLNKAALSDGLKGYFSLKNENKLKDTSVLTIVDFTQSGNQERLFVINPLSGDLYWKSLVAHGQKTGGLYAKHFSNKDNSHQSSIGFYVTGQRWNDYRLGECLQLYGKEYTNYKALTRGIIVHAAEYATCDFINKYGTLGRSYGCPAVPYDGYQDFLNLIDEGTCYFIYYPDWRYHGHSKVLNKRNYLIEFGQDFDLL